MNILFIKTPIKYLVCSDCGHKLKWGGEYSNDKPIPYKIYYCGYKKCPQGSDYIIDEKGHVTVLS